MMVALGLYFISLFLPYLDHRGHMLLYATDLRFYTQMVERRGATSGWEAIPHAWVGICILVGVFATDLCQHRLLRPWIFWAAVPALLFMASPSAPFRASGAALALIAVAVAIWAACANWRTARSA